MTALLVAAILAAAFAQPAHAGEEFNVKVAKHKDGPYKTDINSSFADGQTRTFWFRIRNTGTKQFGLTFSDALSSDADGYSTRWFKAGENVSADVEGDGRNVNIAPGQSKYFSARQTAGDPAEPTCVGGLVSDGFSSDFSSVGINGTKCTF